MLSANNFGFKVKSSDKSLIQIRKNNAPRTDPWGTPASMLTHVEWCPFKATLCFLRLKKSVMILKRIPDIPFYFNL